MIDQLFTKRKQVKQQMKSYDKNSNEYNTLDSYQ